MTDWFEDESFWDTSFPFLFPEERFAHAEEEVGQALALAGVPVATVLDLACGPGTHSLPLARRGLRVTGVDRSALLLDEARRRAASEGLDVEWVHDDMRTFVRPQAFDLAISLFTSFGYFEDREDDLRVLRNVHRSLSAGGVLVLEMRGKEALAATFQPTAAYQAADGGVRYDRLVVTQSWSWVEAEWTFVKDGRARSYRFGHRLFSAREMLDLLHAAGFDTAEAFGGLAGGEYGPGATRLAVVARKEAGRP